MLFNLINCNFCKKSSQHENCNESVCGHHFVKIVELRAKSPQNKNYQQFSAFHDKDKRAN